MKVDIKESWNELVSIMNENKPQLLTGVGRALLIGAVPLTVAATIQASKKVKEKKEEVAEEIRINSENPDILVDVESVELSAMDVAKVVWPYYVPVGVAVIAGTVFEILSTKEGLKRTAAAIVACQLSETARQKYQSATKEVVGEKKSEEIREKVIRDKMNQVLDEDGHIVNIYDTKDGSTLCYDYECGRYFYSDIDYIRSQINQLNQEKNEKARRNGVNGKGKSGVYTTLNEVYQEIGLPNTAVGDSLMWEYEKGLVELNPRSMIVDGRPCWVLAFKYSPEWVEPWKIDQI